MSSWIVARAHISALLNAGLEYGLIAPDADLDAVGQDLWDENHRSVNHRYSHIETLTCPPFHFARRTNLDPSAVEMLAECYYHQTMDHPEAEETHALVFALTLVEACQSDPRYAGKYQNWGAGNKSMWGITRLADVPKAKRTRVAA